MSYPTLSFGSKGKDVETLQMLLNQKLKKEDRGLYAEDIKVNGTFGDHTKEFVKNFQLAAFLKKDGQVGKKTWAALTGTEAFNCYDLPANYVAAPDRNTCWAGATAMLLGQATPNLSRPVGVDFEMVNGQVGGIKNTHANMKKFAYAHYMNMTEGENLTCTQISWLVSNNGRLMLDIMGVDSDLKKSSNNSHFVTLVGLRGDGTAGGTTVTIYDPSGGMNRTIVDSFYSLKCKYPKLTYQVFSMLNNYSSSIY